MRNDSLNHIKIIHAWIKLGCMKCMLKKQQKGIAWVIDRNPLGHDSTTRIWGLNGRHMWSCHCIHWIHHMEQFDDMVLYNPALQYNHDHQDKWLYSPDPAHHISEGIIYPPHKGCTYFIRQDRRSWKIQHHTNDIDMYLNPIKKTNLTSE